MHTSGSGGGGGIIMPPLPDLLAMPPADSIGTSYSRRCPTARRQAEKSDKALHAFISPIQGHQLQGACQPSLLDKLIYSGVSKRSPINIPLECQGKQFLLGGDGKDIFSTGRRRVLCKTGGSDSSFGPFYRARDVFERTGREASPGRLLVGLLGSV